MIVEYYCYGNELYQQSTDIDGGILTSKTLTMIVKKYRYSRLSNAWELIRLFRSDADTVIAKMATDTGFIEGDNIATYKYEAGGTLNGRFDPQFIWGSENGSLFD